MANHLYYGDNLDILRSQIKDESIDLIYLDPRFNSQANYNVLLRSPTGKQSPAQTRRLLGIAKPLANTMTAMARDGLIRRVGDGRYGV